MFRSKAKPREGIVQMVKSESLDLMDIGTIHESPCQGQAMERLSAERSRDSVRRGNVRLRCRLCYRDQMLLDGHAKHEQLRAYRE